VSPNFFNRRKNHKKTRSGTFVPVLTKSDKRKLIMNNSFNSQSRRTFVGQLAAGAAAGFTALSAFQNPVTGAPVKASADAEQWFKKAKGTQRIVYDASEPHGGMPFIWSWVFYLTNNETGVTDNDMTAMVVLRHNAIPFAMEDRLWKKYNLGEVFKITDNTTGKAALRNPFYIPQEGHFPAPGIDGIQKMQARGAMFCVCNMALKVYSGMVAKAQNLNPSDVYEDWKRGVLKDIQIVPSGVWAIARAQQNKFAYCYAGG
jgi:intracellular sulfur oxidation DsrE/DsrF family protein